MTLFKLLAFATLLFITSAAFANDYGAVRGVVHDPQHRPIQDAMVMLKAKSSEWSKSVTTDASGQFQLNAVPLGEYSVSVASQGFAQTAQNVIVISGSVPVVHFQLQVAMANEKVLVSDTPAVVATDSFTPTTLISRLDIERTPGADGTNSMAMITDYVPEPMSPTTCSTCAAATRPHGSSTVFRSSTPLLRKISAAVRSQGSGLRRSQSRQL